MDQPAVSQGEPYAVNSSEYFQTLPVNRNRQTDQANISYDVELETISEGVPLGMRQSFDDVDDVCDLTNSRLSTSPDPRFIASNAGAATIRRMGKHVVDMNRGNDWNTTKYHSMSYLPGPAYGYGYNDITPNSQDYSSQNMYPRVRVSPYNAAYPYVTFSPLAQDETYCRPDVQLETSRPVVLRRPPDGGYRGLNASESQPSDDTRTALLSTGSCISDCTFREGTRDLYL